MNRELYEKMGEATARIETLIHIGCAIGDGDSVADSLSEFWDEDKETIEGVFPNCSESCPDGAVWEFAEYLHGNKKLGFLAKFATPVMKNNKGSISFSWGYYSTKWVYSDTFEGVVEEGLKWVEYVRKEEQGK